MNISKKHLREIVFIDNYKEYELFKKKYNLNNKLVILISDNFTFNETKNLLQKGSVFFDENLDNTTIEKINKDIDTFSWSWFYQHNVDLSLINGCSLGAAFQPSIKILTTSYLRYKLNLEKILNDGDQVFFYKKTSLIFRMALDQIKINKKIQLFTFGTKKNFSSNLMKHIDMDASLRFRDLRYFFVKQSYLKILFKKIIFKLFLKNFSSNKSILIYDSGKLSSYRNHIMKKKNKINERFKFPLNKINLKNIFSLSSNFFLLPVINNKKNNDIENILNNLNDNFFKNKILSDHSFCTLMNIYIFKYFNGAYNYYLSFCKILKNNNTKFLVICDDNFENYLLAAQAAKNIKIKTYFMPHGIYGTIAKNYHKGKFKVFDKSIALSNKNFKEYLERGNNSTEIISTVFPYFEKFVPINKSKLKRGKKIYKKALILAPDFCSEVFSIRLAYEHEYYKTIIEILNDLNIEIIGIKFRFEYSSTKLSNNNSIILNNREIPILSGYESFYDYVSIADLCIGSYSTSIIEAISMGVDYYLIEQKSIIESNFYHKEIFNILNYADDFYKLKKNIINQKIFNEGYSYSDLINFDKFKSKEELFNKFEKDLINN
tara:strand:- start:27712 stop:29520 length:1809 start_codon:yes stop_codon:yes gene_type:complete